MHWVWLTAIRQQNITWTNVDQHHWGSLHSNYYDILEYLVVFQQYHNICVKKIQFINGERNFQSHVWFDSVISSVTVSSHAPSDAGTSAATMFVNSSPTEQNGRHYADDVLGCISMNENFWVFLIKISLVSVPKGPIDNNPALV